MADLPSLKQRAADGDHGSTDALLRRSLDERDPEGYALGRLLELETSAGFHARPAPWDAFARSLDAWPHAVALGDAPLLERRLARWPFLPRVLSGAWLRRLLAGQPCPWAALTTTLGVGATTVDELRATVAALTRMPPPAPFTHLWLNLSQEGRASPDLSFVPALLRSPIAAGVRSLAFDLPLNAKDLRALLEAAATLGVRELSVGAGGALLKPLLASKHLAGITHLDLTIGPLSDGDRRGHMSDQHLALLAGAPTLRQLEHLGLASNALTEAQMTILAGADLPALRSLDLSYNALGAAGVAALTRASWWPALRSLSLNWVRVTTQARLGDQGIAPLLQSPPASLERLSLVGDGIRDAGASAIAHALPGLTWLDLEHNPVRDAGVRALLTMPALQYLDLSHSGVHDDTIASLDAVSPSLRTLRLLVNLGVGAQLALIDAPWTRSLELQTQGLAHALRSGGADLTLDHTVELNAPDNLPRLAASPSLARVRHLRLRWLGEPPASESVRALAASPHASGLRSLRLALGQRHTTHDYLQALAAGSLPSLRWLECSDLLLRAAAPTGGPDGGLAALSRTAALPALAALVLDRVEASTDQLRALASGGGLPELRGLALIRGPLDAHNDAPFLDAVAEVVAARGLRRLKLGALADPAHWRAWLQDERLAGLEHLDPGRVRLDGVSLPRLVFRGLRSVELRDSATALLAALEPQPIEHLFVRGARLDLRALDRLGAWTLRSLDLSNNALTDEHLRALASMPWLATVTHLDLGGNAITGAGLQALAASPHLSALRWLDLSDNPIEPADHEPLLAPGALPSLTTIEQQKPGDHITVLTDLIAERRPGLTLRTWSGRLADEEHHRRSLDRLLPSG